MAETKDTKDSEEMHLGASNPDVHFIRRSRACCHRAQHLFGEDGWCSKFGHQELNNTEHKLVSIIMKAMTYY